MPGPQSLQAKDALRKAALFADRQGLPVFDISVLRLTEMPLGLLRRVELTGNAPIPLRQRRGITYVGVTGLHSAKEIADIAELAGTPTQLIVFDVVQLIMAVEQLQSLLCANAVGFVLGGRI